MLAEDEIIELDKGWRICFCDSGRDGETLTLLEHKCRLNNHPGNFGSNLPEIVGEKIRCRRCRSPLPQWMLTTYRIMALRKLPWTTEEWVNYWDRHFRVQVEAES